MTNTASPISIDGINMLRHDDAYIVGVSVIIIVVPNPQSIRTVTISPLALSGSARSATYGIESKARHHRRSSATPGIDVEACHVA